MSQEPLTTSQDISLSDNEDNDVGEGVEEGPYVSPVFSQFNAEESAAIKKSAGKGLIRPDLPKPVVDKCQMVFIDLTKQTKKIEDEPDICRSIKLLSNAVERQDKYFKTAGVNENMIFDGKAISTNTSVTGQVVRRLQTDTKQFNNLEFADKVMLALDPSETMTQDSDDRNNTFIDDNDWIEFGRKYCRFHNCLPSFGYIYGAFDSSVESAAEPKPVKPRARHQRKEPGVRTGATQIDPKTKTTDDSTPQEVEFVYKTIEKLEKKNPSLPFIDVMVNPNSISETVENVFHSAFLVKDGLVGLKLEDIGDEEDIEGTAVPVIATVDNTEADLTQNDNCLQSVFSFTMNDWKNWIQRFDIKRPAIKHKKKKQTEEQQ